MGLICDCVNFEFEVLDLTLGVVTCEFNAEPCVFNQYGLFYADFCHIFVIFSESKGENACFCLPILLFLGLLFRLFDRFSG